MHYQTTTVGGMRQSSHNGKANMSCTIFLIDQDGGDRGTIESECISDALKQLNQLDESDAWEMGCSWLGAYDVVMEDGREIPITCYNGRNYRVT